MAGPGSSPGSHDWEEMGGGEDKSEGPEDGMSFAGTGWARSQGVRVPLEAGKGSTWTLLWSPQREPALLVHFRLRASQNCEELNLHCFKPPVL